MKTSFLNDSAFADNLFGSFDDQYGNPARMGLWNHKENVNSGENQPAGEMQALEQTSSRRQHSRKKKKENHQTGNTNKKAGGKSGKKQKTARRRSSPALAATTVNG